MIGLLLALVVVLVVWYAARKLLAAFGVPEPWRTVVEVVVIVAGVIYVAGRVPFIW